MSRSGTQPRSPARHLGVLRILAVCLIALALWPGDSPADPNTDLIIGDQVLGTSITADEATSSADASAELTPSFPASSDNAAIKNALQPVTIARLWSPGANVARVDGVLVPAEPTSVSVSVNNSAIGQIFIEPDPDGRFTVDLPNLAPGSTMLCLAEACGQILVIDPDIEVSESLEMFIREGIAVALTRFDVDTHLPGWSISPAGSDNSGVGYTLFDARAIFISATLDQTIEEVASTVLHEIGHALDATQLDDNERQTFRSLRGHTADVPWTLPVDHLSPEGRWTNGAEDFAEVFVAWVNQGDYVTQSRIVSPQPSSAVLDSFCELIASTTIECTR